MSTIGVNPPKTPVTEGSQDKAPVSLPNFCKMPGPPAPFITTPLPNIGESGNSLSECTTTVLFEGKKVAIKGSYYMSKGDMASKGTGGGFVSGTVHGKTEFTAPGSMNVKAEGKNIHLLGDAMSNNGSNPPNSATLPGNMQATAHEQAVANALCDELCAAIADEESSNDLENRLANDPKMKKLGVKFRTFGYVKVLAQTAKNYSRKVVQTLGTRYGLVKIKPDAILGAVVGSNGQISVQGNRCFEIKLPGDRVGRGTQYADQLDRQAQLAGGKRPIVIACPGPPAYGVCTNCKSCP